MCTGASNPGGVRGSEAVHVGKLQIDLDSARRASLHAASGSKTAESILLGLKAALPEWLQHTRAQVRCGVCIQVSFLPWCVCVSVCVCSSLLLS